MTPKTPKDNELAVLKRVNVQVDMPQPPELPTATEAWGMFEADALLASNFINEEEHKILRAAAAILARIAGGEEK